MLNVIEKDLFSIEVEDGEKVVHILHAFTDDCERAPFVRTDFTWCIVEINEFVSEIKKIVADGGDYRDYIINTLEGEVKQYEYEFKTIDKMMTGTLGKDWNNKLTELDYTEITADTPCGLYITKTPMVSETMVQDEMLFTDKEVFGDEKEHEYEVECFDGLAFARPTDGERENNPNAPTLLEISYPKLDTLTYEQKEKCLKYRGLYDQPVCNCNYADVCMCYGMIMGHN